MNCKNCAAPLDVLPGQDYAHCDYCGTNTFLTDLVEVEEVLDEATDWECPVCREPLVRGQIARWRVSFCRRCRGMLIPQDDLPALVAYKRARAYGPPDSVQPINPSHLGRQVDCPKCGRRMDTHPYYGPGQFVIDNCVPCGLIWLDYGELRRAANGRGRDRRPDAALALLLEQLAPDEEDA